MKDLNKEFLKLLKASLYNELMVSDEINNWDDIINLAKIHKVTPMIYESAMKNNSFNSMDEHYKKICQSISMQEIYNQVKRSDRFLKIYEQFNKNNVKAVVFKGIILRDIYPIPDERVSCDEDMLIKKEDIVKCNSILMEDGFKRLLEEDKDPDVYHYFCEISGLHLEIHTSLFGKESSAYNHINKVFTNVFDDSHMININKIDVHTFSIDKHFLYIVCHSIKHFLGCGTGIRQICDIVMYINTYYDKINWDFIWKEINNLGYDTLFVNILQIGIDYLGLDEDKIKYSKDKSEYYINTEDLIEDIMDGGIFGTSSQARLNAANISLHAVSNKKSEHKTVPKSKVSSKMAAVFPNVESLKGRYKYLEKYPILLPIAWISRIITYIKLKGSLLDVRKSAKETIIIGENRIELLKKYKVIK